MKPCILQAMRCSGRRMNGHTNPDPRPCAQASLATPPTNTPSERLFSTEGTTFSKLEILVILKANLYNFQ